MSDAPLLEVTSHINGKNAQVRVYADRVEWERGKSVNKKLLVGTFGMSALAGPAGIMTRKGAGTEVIPMRSITSVTTRRETMLNDVVSVITPGATIDMRVVRAEAQALSAVILQQMNVAHAPAPAAQSAPSTADHIAQLANLHAAGALSDDEFAAAKAKALGL